MGKVRRFAVLAAAGSLAFALTSCSSASAFNQVTALRGVDTILAGFKPDSTGEGPLLLSCPFGEMGQIASTLAVAAGTSTGTLGKPSMGITPWRSGSDSGRAISCSASSSTFAFAVGVQRGQVDEHPAAGAGWSGPTGFGGGDLYIASRGDVCSAAWARKGTFFTVGVQIAKPAVSASKCAAAAKAGVTLVIHALEQTQPFNVVPSSSTSPSHSPSNPSTSSSSSG